MPSTTAADITPAGPSDIPIIRWVLARAFHHGPVLAWVIPDPIERRARLPLLFAAYAEVFLDHGETYRAGVGLLALGGRLLATVLDRCDVTSTPAYLEATSSDNRRLYGRHGFHTIGQLTVPGGPTLWPMWRDPLVHSQDPGARAPGANDDAVP